MSSDPKPARPPAHTASGRDILGWWGWFERGVLLATFGSIVLGVVAFWVDFEDRKQARRVNAATLAEIEEARAVRQQEAITRAWSLITTPATGNSGKGPALEYLNDQKIPLPGIDLSCERMGGGWDEAKLSCERRTYLQGVELQGADLRGAQLQGANLWGAQLQGAKLVGAQLQGADLRRAQLQGAKLGRAQLQGAILWEAQLQGADLYDAQLQRADLWGAQLQGAILWEAQFGGALLSRANFTDARYLGKARFHDPKTGLTAWAWAGQPPSGLEGIAIELCIFDSKRHVFNKRPDPCIPPD